MEVWANASTPEIVLGCLALVGAALAGAGLYSLGVIFILHPIYRRMGWSD